MVALVLKSFPSWIIRPEAKIMHAGPLRDRDRCEGHAKGLPKENNLEKKQLPLAKHCMLPGRAARDGS